MNKSIFSKAYTMLIVVQTVICVIVLFVLLKLQNKSFLYIKITLFTILLLEAFFFCRLLLKIKNQLSVHFIQQCLYISILYAGFIISAILSDITIKIRVKSIIVFFTSALIPLCLFLYLYYYKKRNFSLKNFQVLKEYCLKNVDLIFILLISLLLRIGQYGTIFRWDAGEYYYKLNAACQKFDFSFSQIIENFGLCGHPMYGYALLNAIGEFLFPKKMVGVQLVNLILTLFAIKFVYIIFRKYLNLEKLSSTIFTLLFSVSSTFLGTSTYFHPDYGIAIFIIFIIYFSLEKKYILMIFWACTLCMTKEIGALLYAAFAFSYLVTIFIYEKDNIAVRLSLVLKSPILWGSIVPGCLYLMYMKFVGGISKWRQNPEAGSNFVWNNQGDNCFGFNLEYIWVKVKQLFILNFKWILSLIIIVFMVYCFAIYIKKRKPKMPIMFWQILAIEIIYCLFSALYITASLVRYNIVFDLVEIIMLAYLYSYIFSFSNPFNKCKKIMWNIVLCFLCVLNTIQAYLSIDLISAFSFKKLDTKSAVSIYYPTVNSSTYYGDLLVYNYQYSYIDRAYNAMLTETSYNGEQIIFFPNDGAGLHLSGNGEIYIVNWDTHKKQRTFEQGDSIISICSYSIENLTYLADNNLLTDEAVVFFLPYYGYSENGEIEKLAQYYEIGKRQVYHEVGGELYYYTLKKKSIKQ